MNSTNEETSKVCYYHKFGFCKMKNKCMNRHLQADCELRNRCTQKKSCNGRHRKNCIYFVRNGFCSHEKDCDFLHPTPENDTEKKLDEKINVICEMFESSSNEICRKFTANHNVIIDEKINGLCRMFEENQRNCA